jgi:hypothetical protein
MTPEHEVQGTINSLICNCGSEWRFKDGALEYKAKKRKWVGLTDEERNEIHGATKSPYDDLLAVEAKLKEKNT